MRVLLIDDEMMLAKCIASNLRLDGHEVHVITDTKGVLKFIYENYMKFDVALVDEKMPNITGDVILGEVTAKKFKLPIIIMSGYLDNKKIKVIEELGAYAILPKAVDVDELNALLQEL